MGLFSKSKPKTAAEELDLSPMGTYAFAIKEIVLDFEAASNQALSEQNKIDLIEHKTAEFVKHYDSLRWAEEKKGSEWAGREALRLCRGSLSHRLGK